MSRNITRTFVVAVTVLPGVLAGCHSPAYNPGTKNATEASSDISSSSPEAGGGTYFSPIQSRRQVEIQMYLDQQENWRNLQNLGREARAHAAEAERQAYRAWQEQHRAASMPKPPPAGTFKPPPPPVLTIPGRNTPAGATPGFR